MPRKITRFESFDNGQFQKLRPALSSKAPSRSAGSLSLRGGQLRAPGGVSTGHAVAGAVHALLDCGRAYLNYLESRETTRRMEIWSDTVIQEARETTRRMEIQAEAMVAIAREHSRGMELNAQAAQGEIWDRRESRDARMKIITDFMDARRDYEALFLEACGHCRGNISVEERMFLNRERDVMHQRLKDLDTAVASMSANI